MPDFLQKVVPLAIVIFLCGGCMFLIRKYLGRRSPFSRQYAFLRALLVLVTAGAGVIGIILTLPCIEETMRSELMQLLGVLVGAVIALSSTTFVSNAMAGFMLRIVRNFKSGDLIEAGGYTGRVSEQGVFHTEIQTEESNLVTLPNLFLVTNPVTVTRPDGTMIKAEVSLGYDIPHQDIEAALGRAAAKTELKDSFVQIVELGDCSIVYRVGGMLPEAKGLISARARLRANMLDSLHEDGIEVVSPVFINRRTIAPGEVFIPRECKTVKKAKDVAEAPREDVVFEKAKRAAQISEVEKQIADLAAETVKYRSELAQSKDGENSIKLERYISRNEVYQSHLERKLITLNDSISQKDDTHI
ncbi:MAG: mechanosensitive ion channel family protein [Planctomycetes bacterium]|nr:mechanosensitive ion channel family protein [Planctomycetota bacterium]